MIEGIAPKEEIVAVNGVRLQSLDWGGSGPALIFLAGFGNTPHVFNWLAPRFTDRYHVLGLTRRAHGISEAPEDGYDLPTLAEDVRAFLDLKGIERASFVGHSFAGYEMSCLAAAHPDRVERLVYLDAAYVETDADRALIATNPTPRPDAPPPEVFETKRAYVDELAVRYHLFARLWDERWDAQLDHALEPVPGGGFRERMPGWTVEKYMRARNEYQPDFSAIRCPILAIYSFNDERWAIPEDASADVREKVAAYFARLNAEYRQRCVDEVRRDVADATILVLEDTSHYCFFDREAEVLEAMQAFL